jgi:hypothetical protein
MEMELSELLLNLDRIVLKCVAGELRFEQFIDEYGYPIGEYALDEHESSEEEKNIPAKWIERINTHLAITEQILN